MPHGSRNRTYSGRVLGTGEAIVVVESFQRPSTVQIDLNGGTATVEYTLQNVLYDAAALAAVNINTPEDTGRYVDPAAADWTAVTITAGIGTLDIPVFAIRINATGAGTPGIDYHIAQA